MKGCVFQAYNIWSPCLLSWRLGCEKSQQIVDQLEESETFVSEFQSPSRLGTAE
mgnify:FL=1